MKIDKYNSMIEAFECDMSLAKSGKKSLSDLEQELHDSNSRLSHDITLLEELSFLLRTEQAEIHLKDQPTSTVKVMLRTDKKDTWEHMVISRNGILISDHAEAKKLTAEDVLGELARIGVISLEEENIE